MQLISIKDFFVVGNDPEQLVGEYVLVEMDGRLQPRAQITKLEPGIYSVCVNTACPHEGTCFATVTSTGIPMLSVDFFDDEDKVGASVKFNPCGGWATRLFIPDESEGQDTKKELTLEKLKEENEKRETCIRCKQKLQEHSWFLGKFKFCAKCEKELQKK